MRIDLVQDMLRLESLREAVKSKIRRKKDEK